MSAVITPCPACGTKNRIPPDASGSPRCGSCAGALPWIVTAGDGAWTSAVERAPMPVLVDFWAEWCGPCRMVSPILTELATEFAGRVKLVKVDVDTAPGLSRRFQIQGVPTLAVFDRGRLVSRQSGAAGAPQLRHWLESALDAAGTTHAKDDR